MTLHNISPDNLALALRGASSAVTAAAVSNETKTAYKDALVPLDFIPDWTQTYTVKNNAGDVTYVAGTDYVTKNNGIFIISAGAITSSSTIKVSYTKKGAYSIEGLVNSGYDYRLVFNGLNEAQSAKPVSVTLHRVKFSPTAGLDLIGDDFGKLDLKCSILQDTTIVGQGMSQYIKVQLAN